MSILAAPRMADGVTKITGDSDKITPVENPWGDDLMLTRLQMKSKSRGPGGTLRARNGRQSYQLFGSDTGHWASKSLAAAIEQAQLRSAAANSAVAVLQADNGSHFLTPVKAASGKYYDGSQAYQRVDGLEGYRWVALKDTHDAVKALVTTNHLVDLNAKPPAK